MHLRRTLPLLLVSFAASAIAQTHFCIAGDLDHLSSTQVARCKTQMTNVRDAVKRRGAPSGWHFVVVCDESGWTDYASFIASSSASLKEAAFHTDGGLHWTFVRGSRLDADSPEAAETLLAVALKGIPASAPAPHLIPNPKRVLPQPTLSIASVEPPELP